MDSTHTLPGGDHLWATQGPAACVGTVTRSPHVMSRALSPELVLGSALLEVVRQVLHDAMQARAAAASAPPKSPWMTPPAAARLTQIPLRTIRAWAREGQVQKRIRNRSADAKQLKYLVNVDDVAAAAQRAVPQAEQDSGSKPSGLAERAALIRARAVHRAGAGSRRPHRPAPGRDPAPRHDVERAFPHRPRRGRTPRAAPVREPLHLPQPRPAGRGVRVPRQPHHPPEAGEGGRLLHAARDAVAGDVRGGAAHRRACLGGPDGGRRLGRSRGRGARSRREGPRWVGTPRGHTRWPRNKKPLQLDGVAGGTSGDPHGT
jgi:hypothetical protein